MPYKDPIKRKAYMHEYATSRFPLEVRQAKRRERYLKNRKKNIAQTKAWKQAHPLESQAHWQSSYRKHTERFIAYKKTHNMRVSGAAINDFTSEQWMMLQAAYDHRCGYCGRRAKGHLTQDHITPRSQGGNHTLSNILPACRPCNSRKFTGAPLLPVQPLLL